METNLINCRICNYDISTSTIFIVKEMMFGTKEEFEYYQCENCKALQIKSVPDNISKYYENYYTENQNYIKINNFKKILWGIRSNLALTKLYPIIKSISYNSVLHWAHLSRINKNSNILDVGCGSGDVLYEFNKHGFKNLYGIDPNLVFKDSQHFKLEESDLMSYNSSLKFDLIMFNHSFEHIFEHHDTLQKTLELLTAEGCIMIRIPVINKAFEIYKENWAQIDAPRHFIIHSIKSMNILCEKNDSEVYHCFFDSSAFQFIESEQFKIGISSHAPNAYQTDLSKSIFTKSDIKKYEKKAKKYNKKGLGDSAAFFIRRKRV